MMNCQSLLFFFSFSFSLLLRAAAAAAAAADFVGVVVVVRRRRRFCRHVVARTHKARARKGGYARNEIRKVGKIEDIP